MRKEIECNKVRYKNKKEARTKLNFLQKDRTVRVKPVREYHCPNCNGFHLTHQE